MQKQSQYQGGADRSIGGLNALNILNQMKSSNSHTEGMPKNNNNNNVNFGNHHVSMASNQKQQQQYQSQPQSQSKSHFSVVDDSAARNARVILNYKKSFRDDETFYPEFTTTHNYLQNMHAYENIPQQYRASPLAQHQQAHEFMLNNTNSISHNSNNNNNNNNNNNSNSHHASPRNNHATLLNNILMNKQHQQGNDTGHKETLLSMLAQKNLERQHFQQLQQVHRRMNNNSTNSNGSSHGNSNRLQQGDPYLMN